MASKAASRAVSCLCNNAAYCLIISSSSSAYNKVWSRYTFSMSGSADVEVHGGCMAGAWWVRGGCMVGAWWVHGGCAACAVLLPLHSSIINACSNTIGACWRLMLHAAATHSAASQHIDADSNAASHALFLPVQRHFTLPHRHTVPSYAY